MYKFNRFLKILFLSFQSRILEDASIMCNSWSPRHNVSTTLTIILPSSFSHPNRIQHARTILIYRRKRIGWRDLVTLEVQLKWREEGRKFGRTKGRGA